MALDTRRSNCLLLLLILAFHLHYALSQTTDSSLSFSLTTISDLTTFFTSTIVPSNSTTQLISATTTSSFSPSLILTSTSEVVPTTPAPPTESPSAGPPASSTPSINPPSRFTTIATLTKRFRSARRSRFDQPRESWNWRWCWRRRHSDFYRVSIKCARSTRTHAESKMSLTITSVQVCSIFANGPGNQLLWCRVRPFRRHRR